MAWDLTDDQFAAHVDEMHSFDRTARVQGVDDYFRPASERYDEIFVGDSELYDLVFESQPPAARDIGPVER